MKNTNQIQIAEEIRDIAGISYVDFGGNAANNRKYFKREGGLHLGSPKGIHLQETLLALIRRRRDEITKAIPKLEAEIKKARGN